jgi:hypothetical protein
MILVGFEPTIFVDEQPQTYALDRAATVIGSRRKYEYFTSFLIKTVASVIDKIAVVG